MKSFIYLILNTPLRSPALHWDVTGAGGDQGLGFHSWLGVRSHISEVQIAHPHYLTEVPFISFITALSLNVHSSRSALIWTTICCVRLHSQPQTMLVDQSAAPPMRDLYALNHHPWMEPLPAWIMEESAALSEAEVLEEQMLKAGILASLQDAPDDPDTKVEVPKSSVSSLRLVRIL